MISEGGKWLAGRGGITLRGLHKQVGGGRELILSGFSKSEGPLLIPPVDNSMPKVESLGGPFTVTSTVKKSNPLSQRTRERVPGV